MDIAAAHTLNKETSAFYAENAASFSATRGRPWDGWAKVLALAAPDVERAAEEGRPFRVLDVGCGNMRFERMLADAFCGCAFEFHAVDGCPALACGLAQHAAVCYRHVDVVDALGKDALEDALDAEPAVPACDLVVAFGFLHHVPLPAWRHDLVRALVGRAAPGGLVALALWQFAKNDRMRRKAERTTEAGCARLGVALRAEDGDYLLGWQGGAERLRYCHSFSDDEAAGLEKHADACGATTLASYSADGPGDRSNRYLVLRRRAVER